MNKNGFASEKVMRSYLTALLVDEEVAQPAVKEAEVAEMLPVARLLEKVNVIEQRQPVARQRIEKPEPLVVARPEITTVQKSEPVIEIPPAAVLSKDKPYRKGQFQALFFDVAGLTIAVPLTELGGIHNMGKLNTLFGKPDWFMGVMVHRESKFNVVNTAKWVMPEKYNNALENTIEYQYIIMLDNSGWGLACEKLVNTVTLSQQDVKWREHAGKRPWLAGLIKERMCALLDVSALITLLDQGQSSLEEIAKLNTKRK